MTLILQKFFKICSYISINDPTKVTKNWPALPALPSLTNRSLLLKRGKILKSAQCISILDWLSEHAEVGFGSIREITKCPSGYA